MEIMKAREGKTVYFDATNTTNRILKVLEEERPEIILLDELDKLPRNFAEKLLNFLESGRVKVDQKNCQMDFELKGCKVFATANEINRLSKPLQSRFRKLFLPRYTEELTQPARQTYTAINIRAVSSINNYYIRRTKSSKYLVLRICRTIGLTYYEEKSNGL